MTDHLDSFDGGRAAAAAAAAGEADIRVPGSADASAVAQATSDAAKMAAMFASLGSSTATTEAEPETAPATAAPATRPATVEPTAPQAPAASTSELVARMTALMGGSTEPIASTAHATDAAQFADMAPPLERRPSAAAPAPTPMWGSAPAPRQAPAAPAAAIAPVVAPSADCRVVESRDGIKILWDVHLPTGGGAVVILTPRRSVAAGGADRSLPAHISWRSADAVAAADAKAFARTLCAAADHAATLPPALLE